MIQRNYKMNNKTRWRLYYWMLVKLWLYQNFYNLYYYNFRLMVADLSKQQDVDDEPKTIQQIELV